MGKFFHAVLLLISCRVCCSDFNVVIPEICNVPGRINITWIRDMVLLGIRNEQTNLVINIPSYEDICKGSQGLLKFLSMAYADPSGHLVASLEEHLCPTAATFCHLNQRHVISWTCPKSPGVISVKPTNSDVILAVQRFIRYFGWKRVGFTKSENDGNPFCDNIWRRLRTEKTLNFRHLGNFEDLNENLRNSHNINGLFLCVSYHNGFVQNILHFNREGQRLTDFPIPIPLVILPEWPLPVEIFTPHFPVLALTSNQAIFSPFSVEPHFESKVWETVELGGPDHNDVSKLMETLLAQKILRSVKIGLELDRAAESSSSEREERLEKIRTVSFFFSIVQYEKGRWHTLINLPSGDRSEGKPTTADDEEINNNERHGDGEFFLAWEHVVILIAAVVILLLLFVCISVYSGSRSHNSFYGGPNGGRRKFSRRYRSQGPYKIILTGDDINFGQVLSETNPGKKHLRVPFGSNSHHHGPEEKPDLLKGSFGAMKKTVGGVAHIKPETILSGNEARYRGDLVHLKRLETDPVSFEIKLKTMNILETLHGLRHENLTAMLGCFMEGPPALVWEFCSRGSLHDIIKKNDIKLDWAFKLSLLTDLVRGMRYLHSSLVRVHGSLTSNNCVIDSRWVLKITDYGLSGIFFSQNIPHPHKAPKDLLWTAPELLRDDALRKQGTQPGDVYSFAIMMQEIIVRGEPYCMLTLTPKEILEKLKRPPPMIRPSVSKGAAPPEAINIMRQCWAELPDMRPDFGVIHDLFKTLNHGRKPIIDTMFQMLEKYSNNLEELIRERTEQLDLEKKKTEQLLNRMLPSTVAEKLKLGLPVDPEEFTDVTIYFSDIVGFTTIAAFSTPFEVVDLLNDLYTCFDGTINDYNVYKVETIGDAYMVVGGAPVWSADHAEQIATMALDLLHQSGNFTIRHLPYTPLKLRIGIHTGKVVGGVIGLTMPRYCLFGDTVNTASRMESTGSTWRIHISANTKLKLEAAGGYIIQYRGVTNIKGKGEMPTYWLLGKEGFEKELPTPPGLEESQGLCEDSIRYGRTGIKSDEPPNLPGPSVQSPKAEEKGATLLPLSPEGLRTLSPAEQVAHQLLNGRPIQKGLRRQFSLDQGSSAAHARAAAAFRRAPSLEETSDPHIQPQTRAEGALETIASPSTNLQSSISPMRAAQGKSGRKNQACTIIEETEGLSRNRSVQKPPI